MIIVFTIAQQTFKVRVNKLREMFFSSSHTNNKEIPFDELADQDGNSQEDIDLTKAIVCDLKKDSDVEKYIISEFKKNGLVHVKTIV